MYRCIYIYRVNPKPRLSLQPGNKSAPPALRLSPALGLEEAQGEAGEVEGDLERLRLGIRVEKDDWLVGPAALDLVSHHL